MEEVRKEAKRQFDEWESSFKDDAMIWHVFKLSFDRGYIFANQGKCKFTIEEIKKYVAKSDSLGDVAYFLNEENIDKANRPLEDGRFIDSNDAGEYVKAHLEEITGFAKEMIDPSDNECMLPAQYEKIKEWFYDQEFEEETTMDDFWEDNFTHWNECF